MIDVALFPVRVLLQLLRVYVVYAALAAIFGTLFYVTVAILARGDVAAAAGTVGHFATQVTGSMIGILHFMTFLLFRYHIAPRFPGVAPVVTFAVAAPLGVALLLGVWSLSAFFAAADHGSIADLPQWIAARPSEFIAQLVLAFVLTVVASGLGALIFVLNRGGAYHFGLAKFIGGMLVGPQQYDEFARGETERLQREYDDYASEVRGSKRASR